MPPLQWSASHAVFVEEIDDEHKEILQAVAQLQEALNRGPVSQIRNAAQRLLSCVTGHFAHEERLMTAARYDSLRWHKTSHQAARRRVKQFVLRIEDGD